MKSHTVQILTLIGAAVFGIVLLKLMYDMSRAMTEMNANIATLTADVGKMQQGVDRMAGSVERMDRSMQRMGGAISKGSEQFQRLNPMEMMQQSIPGQGGR